MQRAQRQIVQPTWLTDKSRPLVPSDGIVHINQKNLQEVAELRDEIQKAVNEGRFAVDIEQDQPPQAPPFNVDQQNAQLGPEWPPLPQPLAPATAPQFRPLPLAPFNQAHWALPQMVPWLPVDPQQPNLMQRMWSDFMENTRRMWARN
ncbi:uncharacterized protein LOC118748897 [Rhagoletis pomonella]|uniref:uncharacterized protein LOC118748897 n=1 Tax=Rhagoletis pomonella TaxID=28610 RepID=UPI0017803CCA|nr:uncharacterized protein LOC118748897 [Rhagoletis pomonella]